MKTAIPVINECHAPGLELDAESHFKLTIGISLPKIILEVEYLIKSMIYQMLKFFRRIAFHPEMIL